MYIDVYILMLCILMYIAVMYIDVMYIDVSVMYIDVNGIMHACPPYFICAACMPLCPGALLHFNFFTSSSISIFEPERFKFILGKLVLAWVCKTA